MKEKVVISSRNTTESNVGLKNHKRVYDSSYMKKVYQINAESVKKNRGGARVSDWQLDYGEI